MQETRKLMSHCPYCHAPGKNETQVLRRYRCGSFGLRHTGVYYRRCK